jgi:indolepyruvate ferredoxin oxidoreductase beta subunit
MKKDIILAGVGGQGILTIAAIVDWAALDCGLHIKQAEVHGMSQRGGAVQSHLRISSDEIFSDLIPKGSADVVLSVEPMESLRYLSFLADDGYVVTSSKQYKNIPNYPDENKLLDELNKLPRKILVDAEQLAKEVGNIKASNIVMLGAASPLLDISADSFEKGIKALFERKGNALVELNLKALHAGIAVAKSLA